MWTQRVPIVTPGYTSHHRWNYINEPKPTFGIAEASPEAWRRISNTANYINAPKLSRRYGHILNRGIRLHPTLAAQSSQDEERRHVPLDLPHFRKWGRNGIGESAETNPFEGVHFINEISKRSQISLIPKGFLFSGSPSPTKAIRDLLPLSTLERVRRPRRGEARGRG